jgi:protein involved in polysaccharide export with SLBB domain
VASNWAPLQREGQGSEPSLTAAGYQTPDKTKPAPLPMPPGIVPPSLEPPVKVKPGVTPPPAIRTEPEPLQLHTPRPMPGDPAPVQVGEPMPPVEFAHPSFASGAPHELKKQSLPPYIIEPPDILLIDTTAAPEDIQSVRGQHLVRPDGTIGLGVFGSVYVNGMTLDQAREAVAQAITRGLDPEILKKNPKLAPKASDISLDVYAYNSKVYYVITDGAGFGEQVRRFPVTGNETVLDAISHIDGLPSVASKKKIFIARRTHGDSPPKILPVDWIGITQGALAGTNYQVYPGDRIYVHSQGIIRADSAIGKILAPIERLFGGALLGSSTVNSIRGVGPAFGTPGVR